MPGSCSSGLRSRPSSAAGRRRVNGLEVSSVNSRNPVLTNPITPITRATMTSGRCRLKSDTAAVQSPSISTQRSIEPSCEPQVAAMRYCRGNCELEFVATFSTEKSLLANDHPRHTKARATNRNWPCAAGRATPIQAGMPRAAPMMGRMPWASARMSARISANWPISGIMGSSCFSALSAPVRWHGPLPGACSFRRAWRARPSRGTPRRARAAPAPRRPCPP